MSVEARPLYFLDKNPQGWFDASSQYFSSISCELIQKFRNDLPGDEQAIQDHEGLVDLAGKLQGMRWEQQTGVSPSDSRLSIIIPIHDERWYLPSMLGTLMMADIPYDVHLRIILITNACSDRGKTEKAVGNFLNGLGDIRLGNINDGELPDNLSDPGISSDYAHVSVGNLEFIHLDTSTRGKANALNIGNKIAAEHGPIALCLDANDFPEPASIARLYGAAHKRICRDKDGTAIVSGISLSDSPNFPVDFLNKLYRNAAVAYRDLVRKDEVIIHGGIFAWDTELIDQLGGVPRVAHEDYGLGVLTRVNGRRVAHDTDAKSWKQRASSFWDRINLNARVVRGNTQLINRYPQTEQVVKDDLYYMNDFYSRLNALLRKIYSKPLNTFFYIATFGIWEISRIKGRCDYRKNPDDESWEPIISTKT